MAWRFHWPLILHDHVDAAQAELIEHLLHRSGSLDLVQKLAHVGEPPGMSLRRCHSRRVDLVAVAKHGEPMTLRLGYAGHTSHVRASGSRGCRFSRLMAARRPSRSPG